MAHEGRTLADAIRQAVEEHVRRRYAAEERERIVARAQRKGRRSYRMTPEQARVFRRIRASGGALSQLEYLAEDWRVTNPMFSRGWLTWRRLNGHGGEMRVVLGDRAPALELRAVR